MKISRNVGTYPELSPREKEVFELACNGYEDDEIAERLGIERGTVRTTIRRVMEKTGTRSRLHAAMVAIRNGMIDVGLVEA